jgi:hypothetical protein
MTRESFLKGVVSLGAIALAGDIAALTRKLALSGSGTIIVTSGNGRFAAGDVVILPSTGEHLLVTGVNGHRIEVRRMT